jgi:hypothetical protein
MPALRATSTTSFRPITWAISVPTMDRHQLERLERQFSVAFRMRITPVYFSILTSDTDPATNPDFWMSRGSAHVWNLLQPQPATSGSGGSTI